MGEERKNAPEEQYNRTGPTVQIPLRGPGRPGGGPMRFMGPKEKPKDTRGTLLRLWSYLGRQRWQLLLAFGLVLTGVLVGLAGPYLIGRGIDVIAYGGGSFDFERLFAVIRLLALVYVVNATTGWLQNYVVVGVAQRTVRELRKDLFAKIQRLPVRYFDAHTHGELMSRLANDVENVSNTLTQSTIQIFSSILTVIGVLGVMLVLNPLLTLLSMVGVPLGFYLSRLIIKRTRNFYLAQQRELGHLNGYIEEIITGQRVVKAFCREPEVLAHFAEVNDRLKAAGIKAQVFSGIIPPLMNVVNNLNYALVTGVGGWLAIQGVITLGVITSFLNYSKQFARPLNEIANQVNMMQSALAGAERVFEVLNEAEEEPDVPAATALTAVQGEVEFRDVSFGYLPNVPVLRDVNIHARPGQTIALVGPTGAGKTTVVNLLMRFYDVSSGGAYIDGEDIRTYQKDTLRRSLGIVLQDTYLFSGTVRENIRYGRLDATDDEVERAALLADADIFIRRLPSSYDTVLSAGGGNLSQGQRQLLTIARAILADPAILVLDEATSSVDTRTEMHIQKAMLSLMKGRTSFVIAHRLSTIQGADEILFINGGQIVERGTHEQLLAAQGFYYKLYSSQFRRQSELVNLKGVAEQG